VSPSNLLAIFDRGGSISGYEKGDILPPIRFFCIFDSYLFFCHEASPVMIFTLTVVHLAILRILTFYEFIKLGTNIGVKHKPLEHHQTDHDTNGAHDVNSRVATAGRHGPGQARP